MKTRSICDSRIVAGHIGKVSRSLALIGFTMLALCSIAMVQASHRSGAMSKVDTTSEKIVWSVDTIGADGSTLYDCCVINDTLAYAVGWIMPYDSAAQSHSLDWYNAAVWNGSKWKLIQIPVYYNGRKTYSPIHSVFARGKDDVWFGLYYMVHWNGRRYSQVFPRIGSFENKIWESAGGSRLYVVGDNGMISYSSDHGNSWTPVRTGTNLPFQDVWGGGGQVLAVASDNSSHQYVVSLKGDAALHLKETFPFVRSISGVWFVPDQEYFAVGNGIFENKNLVGKIWRFDPFIWKLNHYISAVRGSSSRDVFIAGLGGCIAHWNGRSWRDYPQIENTPDRLRAVSTKEDLVVAAGERYYDNLRHCGVIYTGIRRTFGEGFRKRKEGGDRTIASFR